MSSGPIGVFADRFSPPPPPPEFRIPPPPIPHFVDPACQEKMLTNNDLLHLSSYLIVGCILLMVFFSVAACSLRCCTASQLLSGNDWQQEALLDNCEQDLSEETAENERDQKTWWQSQVKMLRIGLRQSIEAASRQLRRPREYSINEDFSSPPVRPDAIKSPASGIMDMSKCSPSQQNDWPLSPLLGEDADRPPIVIIPSVSRNVADTRRSLVHQPQRN